MCGEDLTVSGGQLGLGDGRLPPHNHLLHLRQIDRVRVKLRRRSELFDLLVHVAQVALETLAVPALELRRAERLTDRKVIHDDLIDSG